MLVADPFLGNRQATELPKPWIKWSFEPGRPVDVPSALVRGLMTAMSAPAGPVYM